MADRTQLKAADRNDIAADDPFAELTRIMGFDPRQPVKPQAPAVEKASADHLAVGGDFDIDLEKELMGEFGSDADDRTAFAEVHEPAFETAAAEAMDEALAASLEQDFLFDDAANEAGHFFAAAGDLPAPSVEAAFDDDFDNALASSLEDVSPLEDDLPMDDGFASSVEQGFLLDGNAADEAGHSIGAAEIPAPALDAAFDNPLASSLEDVSPLEDDLPMDDGFASSVEQEFRLDGNAADEAGHSIGAAEIPAPDVEAAFDNPLGSSLEDVSPLEDDLPMDDGFASSVEQAFLLDGNTTDEAMHGTGGVDIPAPDAEAAFDDDFHSAVSASLEEELTLGHLPAQVHHAGPANVEYQAAPVEAVADADHGISDADFAGHFDDVMTDLDVDLEDRTSEPAVIEEPQAHEIAVGAAQAKDEASDVAAQEAFDSDFHLTFNDEIAEEVEEPIEQIAAVTAAPTSPASVEQRESEPVTVAPAMPAAAADERSLEDELNALLSAMTARTVPVAMEPFRVQPVETAEQAADEPTDPVGSLDWNLDEHEERRGRGSASRLRWSRRPMPISTIFSSMNSMTGNPRPKMQRQPQPRLSPTLISMTRRSMPPLPRASILVMTQRPARWRMPLPGEIRSTR